MQAIVVLFEMLVDNSLRIAFTPTETENIVEGSGGSAASWSGSSGLEAVMRDTWIRGIRAEHAKEKTRRGGFRERGNREMSKGNQSAPLSLSVYLSTNEYEMQSHRESGGSTIITHKTEES